MPPFIWANNHVCFYTDNEALIPIINSSTSREPHIMALLRRLVLACLRFNINFMSRHVPGRDNVLADRLSCAQVEEFRKLAPWADALLMELPRDVLPEG